MNYGDLLDELRIEREANRQKDAEIARLRSRIAELQEERTEPRTVFRSVAALMTKNLRERQRRGIKTNVSLMRLAFENPRKARK